MDCLSMNIVEWVGLRLDIVADMRGKLVVDDPISKSVAANEKKASAQEECVLKETVARMSSLMERLLVVVLP